MRQCVTPVNYETPEGIYKHQGQGHHGRRRGYVVNIGHQVACNNKFYISVSIMHVGLLWLSLERRQICYKHYICETGYVFIRSKGNSYIIIFSP